MAFWTVTTCYVLISKTSSSWKPVMSNTIWSSKLRKQLDLRQEKDVTTSTLVELAEVVLKNNVFTFMEKTLKQKQGTAIGTKFAPPYSILFIA